VILDGQRVPEKPKVARAPDHHQKKRSSKKAKAARQAEAGKEAVPTDAQEEGETDHAGSKSKGRAVADESGPAAAAPAHRSEKRKAGNEPSTGDGASKKKRLEKHAALSHDEADKQTKKPNRHAKASETAHIDAVEPMDADDHPAPPPAPSVSLKPKNALGKPDVSGKDASKQRPQSGQRGVTGAAVSKGQKKHAAKPAAAVARAPKGGDDFFAAPFDGSEPSSPSAPATAAATTQEKAAQAATKTELKSAGKTKAAGQALVHAGGFQRTADDDGRSKLTAASKAARQQEPKKAQKKASTASIDAAMQADKEQHTFASHGKSATTPAKGAVASAADDTPAPRSHPLAAQESAAMSASLQSERMAEPKKKAKSKTAAPAAVSIPDSALVPTDSKVVGELGETTKQPEAQTHVVRRAGKAGARPVKQETDMVVSDAFGRGGASAWD
jgi:hypothetical protein